MAAMVTMAVWLLVLQGHLPADDPPVPGLVPGVAGLLAADLQDRVYDTYGEGSGD